jgi:hypothetical protein
MATFGATYIPPIFFLTTTTLFHVWKFAHQLPSHSQESLSFIRVKQDKISWDKFLKIPANFEIKSQQI